MSMPDIHSCSKLSAENSTLRKKLRQLKYAKEDAERRLHELLEKKKVEQLLKSYCTTRDSTTQTEVRPWMSRGYSLLPLNPQPNPTETDLEKANRMINMHAQILRRYEKEVKQNMTHTETISELTVKVAALEKKLHDEQTKNGSLEKQLWALKGSKQQPRGKVSSGQKHVEADPVLREVVEERNKLDRENKRLRQELKGLDKGFFEEIEDLKYALQQSAKLNKEYGKTLHKLCQQHGLPYPYPERVLDKT